jgi:flavin-dependent dehydrogenase
MQAFVPASAEATALRAHHLPLVGGRPVLGRDRVLLVGDAAGLINPLTGEGIWYALLSGMLAGRAAVAAADPGRQYRRDLRRALRTHHASVRMLAPLVTTPLLVDGGLRAARRHQAVFDDLVELGLANGELTPRLLAGTARHALAG